jgi:hypothetical protein
VHICFRKEVDPSYEEGGDGSIQSSGHVYKKKSTKDASKKYCILCRKFGHDDAYCFNNIDNPNNQLFKDKSKGMVVVNEVSVHSIGSNARKQQFGRSGSNTHNGDYSKSTSCYIY